MNTLPFFSTDLMRVYERDSRRMGRRRLRSRGMSLCALFCSLVACFEPGRVTETDDAAPDGTTGDAATDDAATDDAATGESTTGESTTGESTTGESTTGDLPTGDPTNPDESGSSGGNTDTTPPTVLSVSPENGDAGVLADVAFVFEFSERMDTASTEAAYQSSDLPSTEVSFAWNGEGTTMTVVPNEPLVLAAGSSDSVVARTYSFSLTASATDLAGNELATPIDVSFSTARRLTMQFTADPDLSGITNPGGTYYETNEFYAVGDWGNSFPPGVLRAPLTFDISEIPDPVVAWIWADITLTQTGQLGAPYPTHGSLHVHDVSFASLNVEAGESPGDDLGILSDEFVDNASTVLTVTDAVAEDHASGRTQFLLMFDDENPDSDTNADSVEGGLSNINLEVRVLVE